MQTLVVIPILPHGVVQLGSSLSILENIGFVNDVRSSSLQLGFAPGALLSDNYTMKDSAEKLGLPVSFGVPVSVDPSESNFLMNSSPLIRQIQNKKPQHPNQTQTLSKSCDYHCQTKATPMMEPNFSFNSQLENEVIGAEVIPSNPDAWLNHRYILPNSRSHFGCHSDVQDHLNKNSSALSTVKMSQLGTSAGLILDPCVGSVTSLSEESKLHGEVNNHSRPNLDPCSLPIIDGAADSSKTEGVSLHGLPDRLTTGHMISGKVRHISAVVKHNQNELAPRELKIDTDLFQAVEIPYNHPDNHMSLIEHIPDLFAYYQNCDNGNRSPCTNAKLEHVCAQPSSADNLFDTLGVEFKNKLLNDIQNNFIANESDANSQNMGESSVLKAIQGASADFYSVIEALSESGIYSGTGSDYLLDAVVSGAHSASKQRPDDTVSCTTALTKISSSCVPCSYPTHGGVRKPEHVQRELFDLSKALGNMGTIETNSFRPVCGKDDAGNLSRMTPIYGSYSSWVEQSNNVKRNCSVSSAYSKKPDEINKLNCKRLKPGVNPRPRPKDRQRIQDHVKELREIVPNGAKCSIDALLERTIKHMLFLQSVTNHADKLKRTGNSKIVCNKGGLLLKDNFEGGTTWAYEVGSQSMACPITVEDLNQPHQMLVEMLFEERGFFLEIAEIIRGLGLTILKGVMEARSDKIWACFAVETNRDIARMEIFLPLVQLLEQNAKVSAASANAIDDNNTMVHQSFHQAVPIPATGRPCNLQ
ncbi:hypothetical protein I3843_14G094500 [Carya illinoinensis]|nr:hypothetical protein I3842_14G096600 [Carya illinoinensis]KAG7947453.1 hypothetical protein I3843_14G094500 [Carya illinoinensis]